VQARLGALLAEFDAIIAPTNGPAWLTDFEGPDGGDLSLPEPQPFIGSSSAAAISGWADITVPAGYARDVLPIGVTFIGGQWDEPDLIGFAFDFEQATLVRVPPQFIPSIGD
jgi:amidase